MRSLTKEIISKAGWYEHRHVDTSDFEKALATSGYTVLRAQLDFLREFGGLRIQPSPRSILRFDVADLLGQVDGTADLTGLMGGSVSFLGIKREADADDYMTRGDAWIMIGESGEVRYIGEQYEVKIGNSHDDDIMDKMCIGHGRWRVQKSWIRPGH